MTAHLIAEFARISVAARSPSVAARSPDRAAHFDRRSPALDFGLFSQPRRNRDSGDLRSRSVARSGDRATTGGRETEPQQGSGDRATTGVARSTSVAARSTSVAARSPDRAAHFDRRSPALGFGLFSRPHRKRDSGDLRSRSVARSGDRATTGVARSGDRATTGGRETEPQQGWPGLPLLRPGLPTVPHTSTAGLPHSVLACSHDRAATAIQETFGPVAWHGPETEPQQGVGRRSHNRGRETEPQQGGTDGRPSHNRGWHGRETEPQQGSHNSHNARTRAAEPARTAPVEGIGALLWLGRAVHDDLAGERAAKEYRRVVATIVLFGVAGKRRGAAAQLLEQDAVVERRRSTS